jgi:hypothetical protein
MPCRIRPAHPQADPAHAVALRSQGTTGVELIAPELADLEVRTRDVRAKRLAVRRRRDKRARLECRALDRVLIEGRSEATPVGQLRPAALLRRDRSTLACQHALATARGQRTDAHDRECIGLQSGPECADALGPEFPNRVMTWRHPAGGLAPAGWTLGRGISDAGGWLDQRRSTVSI